MSLDLPLILASFPDLVPNPLHREGGTTAFRLKLPHFMQGREFTWVELRLPKGFPEYERAKIVFSPDAVLRVPHLDNEGVLCSEGEPGPVQGYSPEDRILLLLQDYQEHFIEPWLAGFLDDHFADEALDYWLIEVTRARTFADPVRVVWTVDDCPHRSIVRQGLLLLPARTVIAADEDMPITNRLVRALHERAKQRIKVLVADIPITYPLTPSTWPRSSADLNRLINGRLRPIQRKQFLLPLSRRGRGVHRIVLLRNRDGAFAYLLPGGPPTVVEEGKRAKTYPSLMAPLPLSVMRLDPDWTVGRDQHSEVSARQKMRVLVLGAGALGSPVVDHLAKAGIGSITLVDPESLVSANVGRHLLGVESIGNKKANAVADRVNYGYPATIVTAQIMSAERWLKENSLLSVDIVLDLTGEPDVRWHVDRARSNYSRPLLIGWMEPYVAASHVCLLPAGVPWIQGLEDPMGRFEAVSWPADVIRHEPGCSSKFQSYTAAAATYAVALVAENALKLIDGAVDNSVPPRVVSWVRGQRFLDEHWKGLSLRGWAGAAAPHDGLMIERSFF